MFKKLFAKAAKPKNPLGLNKDFVAKLTAHLGRLGEVDPELAGRTLRFVIDDEDEDVVLTLGGLPQTGAALCVQTAASTQNWKLIQKVTEERAAVFRAGKGAPSAVWIRLGRVLEAVSRAVGKTFQTPPGWPGWLAALVEELFAAWQNPYGGGDRSLVWAIDDLEGVLKAAGLSTDLIARTFLDPAALQTLRGGYYVHYQDNTGPFSDWAPYLVRHLDAVREVLGRPDADTRVFALQNLTRVGFDFTPLVDVLVQIGTGPAKTARETALPLLQNLRDRARPHVAEALAGGDSAQRHEAAQLLWRLDGEKAADRLRQHAAGESSERVKQTIDKLLAAPTQQAADAGREVDFQLPPVQIETGVVPFPAEGRAGLRAFFDQTYQNLMRQYERSLEQWNSPNRPKGMTKPEKPKPLSDVGLESLVAFLEGKADKVSKESEQHNRFAWNKTPFGDWFAPPAVRLIHVLRTALAFNTLSIHDGPQLWWHNAQDLEAYRGRCHQPFGLRELDAAVATLPGGRPGLVAMSWLANNTQYHSFCDWEPEAIWPLFAEYPDVLREVLTAAPNRTGPYSSRDYSLPNKRRNAFRVLAMFPQLPPGFVPLLWDIALGDSKSDRPLAQAALATVPDKAAKIRVALGDGRQVLRATAAEWLGQIGDRSAIEPLKEAFRKEKQEIVKGAIMAALEELGADVHEFLDRDELLREAEAGLAKKRPKGMEWVPLDALPRLHWQDTGKAVDPRIVQWWVVQGIQQKTPVAGPLLRRYLALCRPDEAAALARFVLASWIGHDTATPTHEEAADRAQKEADRQWAQWGQHQYFQQMFQGKKENLYQQLFQKFSNECKGSAIGEKGMLALVSAAGDGDCVKLCDNYIRKWFGNRLAQCKCLVEVLAWIKHPLAIQVLLGLANRFRTKAIRKMAEEHVQALAEREGWTVDELADRTIPDAGFERAADEAGRPVGEEAALVLDYGPRQFTVRLDDDLQPVIATADGKTVKNLPAPGKNDDADKAKAAKKAFGDAKKVVKEVVKRQTERLYEALCTQRGWRFDDWRRYLAAHPIAGRLCVRLAWAAFAPGQEGKSLGCFRPLEDGSLTNEKDEEVTFEPEALVRVAHPCNTPPEVAAAWAQHFADYDVTPLFPQFGRDTYRLPEDKRKETDVKDFEGHALTTFKLRGKATKLGYVRGEAEDGGCFYLYRKPFPSLALQAVVEFTGSALPEEDRPAALIGLYFTRLKGDREAESYWQPSKLELGKVPPVLLSECYNDLRQMAAEGSGFDPKWRETSYY